MKPGRDRTNFGGVGGEVGERQLSESKRLSGCRWNQRDASGFTQSRFSQSFTIPEVHRAGGLAARG